MRHNTNATHRKDARNHDLNRSHYFDRGEWTAPKITGIKSQVKNLQARVDLTYEDPDQDVTGVYWSGHIYGGGRRSPIDNEFFVKLPSMTGPTGSGFVIIRFISSNSAGRFRFWLVDSKGNKSGPKEEELSGF